MDLEKDKEIREARKQHFIENMQELRILSAECPDDLKILKTACEPVSEHGFDDDLFQTAVNMGQTMIKNGGIGLAANQVGCKKRLIVVKCEGIALPMVNPIIIKRSNPKRTMESCLSVPGKIYSLKRPKSIKVKFHDLEGTEYTRTMKGDIAYCVQHEIDHLNGKLITRGTLAGTKQIKQGAVVNPTQSNSSVGGEKNPAAKDGETPKIIGADGNPISASIKAANANSQAGD